MRTFLSLFLLLSFSISFAPEAHSAVSCLYVHSRQSAAEVEIGNAPLVMALFTTMDGTIAPVLGAKGIEALDPQVRRTLEEAFPGEDVTALSWDLLSFQEKTAVLQTAARVNKHRFFESRTIPGLKYIETATLTFKTPTTLLGTIYRPGTYQISTADIFGVTAIEYMGPNRMTENLGFELHVRSSRPANINYQTARGLQVGLTGEPMAMHLHVVAPIAADPSVRLSEAEAFRRTEFHRRVSLLYEMKMIARGVKMAKIKNESATDTQNIYNFYEYSPQEALLPAFKYFGYFNIKDTATKFEKVRMKLMGKKIEAPELFSKSGTVGIRSSEAYDSVDTPLWGIEIRYLSPHADGKREALDLAAIQGKMTRFEYTMTMAEAEAYLADQMKSRWRMDNVVTELWYSPEINDKAIHQVARFFNQKLPQWKLMAVEQKNQLLDKFKGNSFLYMILHDWSQDPLFVDQPKKLAQMVQAQKIAQQEILRPGYSSVEVMQTFIKRSGLEYLIRSSFGI